MNDCHFKLVKFRGEFVWHEHTDTDEAFMVLDGEMVIHFRNDDAPVKKGEVIVIPKGVQHKTSAKDECRPCPQAPQRENKRPGASICRCGYLESYSFIAFRMFSRNSLKPHSPLVIIPRCTATSWREGMIPTNWP